MANRYIDTGFYKSPFVRGLKAPLKTLYSFIICDCNGAGIWVKDLPIASVFVGAAITENEFKESFIKTGKAVDLNNGKFFFPDFIEHQYPKGLNKDNPAHNNFILELKRYGLIDENLRVLKSPLQGTNVMVKVIDKVKVTNIEFALFWNLYDKKVGDKTKLSKKWGALKDEDRILIMNHIPKYKSAQPNKKYRKDPQAYFNNKTWLDEIIGAKPVINYTPTKVNPDY